jgi:hypothetical protein
VIAALLAVGATAAGLAEAPTGAGLAEAPTGAGLAEAPTGAGLGPGDRLTPFRLEDQHGVVHEVDATRRAVLLSRDMEGGGHVREALAEDGAQRLARADAVYVADVSRMPGLVRRIIAEPRMRSRPYPVLVDRSGEVSAGLPSEPGRATLIVLEGLEVRAVRSLDTSEAVRESLDALARSEDRGSRPEHEPEP